MGMEERRGERQRRGEGRAVMNGRAVPSRMASNLCYKEGHPSGGRVAVLAHTRRGVEPRRSHAGREGVAIRARGDAH